jgi:tetratricopeptide (TPR) repeat protein
MIIKGMQVTAFPFLMVIQMKKKAKPKKIQQSQDTFTLAELNQLVFKFPNDLTYLQLRGEAYLRLEQFELAIRDFARIVSEDNRNINALINFGSCLIRCNQYDQAKDILEYILELDPNNLNAHINICSVYQALGKPEESLKMAFRAIEINPGAALAYNNLGTALGDLQMIDGAREAFKTALAIDPSYVPTVVNFAQLEVKLGHHDEAIILYENILKNRSLTKNHEQLIKYFLSYSYLLNGNLKKGWDYYEFGFGPLLPLSSMRSMRKFEQPKWHGQVIGEKTLMIWREQGIGDEIEFLSCLPDVLKITKNIILECESRLVSIYSRLYPEIIVRTESNNDRGKQLLHDFDYQCPVGSLPRLFRQEIKSFQKPSNTYLALIDLKKKFSQRLLGNEKLLVGISWRSGKLQAGRNDHYTGLLDWKELLSHPNVQCVNLQYGDCESELLEAESQFGIKILRWPDVDLKNDLESIIALIQSLDCVVSVGTAVSSLSAASGVKTFLLTPKTWILLGQTEQYPWFDSVIPLVSQRGQLVAENIKHLPDLLHKHFPSKI